RAEVGFVTRVGQDSLSDAFVAEMAADGVSVQAVSRAPDRNMGLYLIALDGVERSFHYWRSQSAARMLADDPARLARDLAHADLIHLSGITVAILSPSARATMLAALSTARAQGARLSFDPNVRPALWRDMDEVRDALPAFFALADILLPSFDDETTVWGDATPNATLERLAAFGASEVVVKDGAGPVWFWHNSAPHRAETPAAPGIRDTTGAGDAFNAGYLLARALGHPPAMAVGYGQSLAALVLQFSGARATKSSIAALPPIDRLSST
ncbi:MAG: sugar kinase, partial [Rhodobacteraceae bacterium]|nr:sugar kinase [Paracoccaceae bacterium]